MKKKNLCMNSQMKTHTWEMSEFLPFKMKSPPEHVRKVTAVVGGLKLALD